MRPARELALAVTVLLLIQLLTSFGAIALFGRMTPAIAKIIDENAVSLEAVAEMLGVLAEAQEVAATPAQVARFDAALEIARANITEEQERPLLRNLGRLRAAALRGVPEARDEALQVLLQLSRVNLAAMRVADDDAQRLGMAGAWAAVFLGLLGLLASVLTVARMGRTLITPLEEIRRVLKAQRSGDPHRRCAGRSNNDELGEVMGWLNELLDHRERALGLERPNSTRTELLDERRVLLSVLDQYEEPVVIVDDRGKPVTANQRAMDLLGAESGDRLKEVLSKVPSGQTSEEVQKVTPIDGLPRFICVLRASVTAA